MNPKQQVPPPPPPGLALADVYYIVFRHKRLICACFCLGLFASAAVYKFWPKKYFSEAKLYLSYVLETKAPREGAGDATVKELGGQGEKIVEDERQILGSFDLAVEVASNIGPMRIIGKVSPRMSPLAAAAVFIQNNLQVEVPAPHVISIAFTHSDPFIVQPVMNQVVESYVRRHSEAHHPVGEFEDFLTAEAEKYKTNLSLLDNQLREKKADAKIISLEGSEKDLTDRISKLHQQIDAANSDLSGHKAAAEELRSLIAARAQSEAGGVSVSNAVSGPVSNAAAPNNLPEVKPPTAEQISEYRRLIELLENRRKTEAGLSVQFTPEWGALKAIQAEISQTQSNLAKLTHEAPGLVAIKTVVAQLPGAPATVAAVDPAAALRANLDAESVIIKATQARVDSLNERLAAAEKEASDLAQVEAPISELVRKRGFAETNYQHLATSLEQASYDQRLSTDKAAPNIHPIEKPTPPFMPKSKRLKIAGGVFAGLTALGIGLAFVIEMFIDRTYKRPEEIDGKLSAPLLLSIPWMNGHVAARALPGPKSAGLLSQGNGAAWQPGTALAVSRSSASVVMGDLRFRPFYETLRDRVISYFEALGLTHKPKLIAVSACHAGAGTTKTATSLAASLSETGDGRVLLVDMNGQDGTAHRFYNGELECGIADALQKEKRDSAMVQDNLYVAKELATGNNVPPGLPKRFSHLVPVMKASDYDYIIFDMPPVSQISITPRLAGFVDMVLLVIESEKTDRDVAGRALGLLSAAKANVGIVLNKKRSYVPSRILPEM